MIKKPNTAWYCANKECGSVLGYVASNELVIDVSSENVLTLNTNGTSLVATCAKCASPKTWYPSLESSVIGAENAKKREMSAVVKEAVSRELSKRG